MDQRQLTLLVAVVVVVVAVAVIVFILSRKRRSQQLRQRFGPEYDRVVKKEGEVRRAEGVLEMRAKRREKFTLRPLPEASRLDFAERWRAVQAQFVDEPAGSVSQADALVNELMAARGYPMSDFEQQAADISVDHPMVVENYRAAHAIAEADLIKEQARLSSEREIASYNDAVLEVRREHQRAIEAAEKAKSELRSVLMTHLSLLENSHPQPVPPEPAPASNTAAQHQPMPIEPSPDTTRITVT